jgi:ribonucleoside-triphosphate reductase (thioredoxin)
MNLPTEYQNFIHLSRYSRWMEEEGRRESWDETIARYFNFFEEHLKENNNYKVTKNDRKELEEAILNQEVMPSMRSLMTAGEALHRDNVAGYNCAYMSAGRVRAFDELVYILMCGTGMGFSVERGFLEKLPTLADEFELSDTVIAVADSKVGWAKAYKELTSLLIGGQIPKWDMSKIREAGARLKTFGGRASGPDPLEDLFNFTVSIYRNASGRKLTSLECHDIFCKIAEVVVVGGVRRSALISLSSLTDERMRGAKTGQWWYENGQRALANNSVAYKCKPEMGTFMEEWVSLYKSKSGERGIFNREAAVKKVEQLERRDPQHEFGTNPCSEIILRDRQFCNLSEVVIRKEDTIETLKDKVRLATILGTWQCTLTNFRYLSSEWKKNCEEERLLGVSLTGIMDNDLTNGNKGEKKLIEALEELRQVAIETNQIWAKKFKINESAAITCVKPSGTVSQLVDSASGIHSRHAEYYVRTVRADMKDPLCVFMQEKGFPCEPDVTKPEHTTVFSFPMKSSTTSIFRDDKSAIEQLEHWLLYQRHWCEHKPSVTISVREEEWLEVGAWVYDHFDEVSGVSFLPHSDHIYRQAPYQDCTKKEYQELLKKMPKSVDWSELENYEKEDNTSGTQALACSAGSCEIVDLTT